MPIQKTGFFNQSTRLAFGVKQAEIHLVFKTGFILGKKHRLEIELKFQELGSFCRQVSVLSVCQHGLFVRKSLAYLIWRLSCLSFKKKETDLQLQIRLDPAASKYHQISTIFLSVSLLFFHDVSFSLRLINFVMQRWLPLAVRNMLFLFLAGKRKGIFSRIITKVLICNVIVWATFLPLNQSLWTVDIHAFWLSLGHCGILVAWVESHAQDHIFAQMKSGLLRRE